MIREGSAEERSIRNIWKTDPSEPIIPASFSLNMSCGSLKVIESTTRSPLPPPLLLDVGPGVISDRGWGGLGRKKKTEDMDQMHGLGEKRGRFLQAGAQTRAGSFKHILSCTPHTQPVRNLLFLQARLWDPERVGDWPGIATGSQWPSPALPMGDPSCSSLTSR